IESSDKYLRCVPPIRVRAIAISSASSCVSRNSSASLMYVTPRSDQGNFLRRYDEALPARAGAAAQPALFSPGIGECFVFNLLRTLGPLVTSSLSRRLARAPLIQVGENSSSTGQKAIDRLLAGVSYGKGSFNSQARYFYD
ncbi:60 kDa chaperonin 1, partial [Striga asiatica]